jgi:hypothetical protein
MSQRKGLKVHHIDRHSNMESFNIPITFKNPNYRVRMPEPGKHTIQVTVRESDDAERLLKAIVHQIKNELFLEKIDEET